jgi:Tfp pilus assembly PilM family ATPase
MRWTSFLPAVAKLMPGAGGVGQVAHENVPPVGRHLANAVLRVLTQTDAQSRTLAYVHELLAAQLRRVMKAYYKTSTQREVRNTRGSARTGY